MRALLRAGRRSAATVGRLLPRARSIRDPLRVGLRPAATLALVVAAMTVGSHGTQDAVANGDTRSLSFYHEHTKEAATITFKRDGRFDSAALQQLNWLLRDWRLDEPTKMDPRLFDVVWEAQRAVGSQDAIHILSAYRSPNTNAMLRRRSRAVAEHSQHMLGKAMDIFMPDVSIDQIRAVGMRMQRGGVGWYPNSGSPFVHLDVGSVRSWPRMGHDQLARLFPDGRTVHLPSDNRPLGGYEEAKAEILARGGSVAGYTQVASAEETTGGGRSFWQMLFGGGGDDEDSSFYGMNNGGAGRGRPQPPVQPRPVQVASASSDDAGTRGPMAYAAAQPDAANPLRSSLFRSSQAARTVPLRTVEEPQAAPASVAPAATPSPVSATVLPVAQVAMPLPPRRPDALAVFAEAHGIAAEAVPLPPSRRLMLASADGSVMPAALALPTLRRTIEQPAPSAAATDDKAHLKALFAAAVAPPRVARGAPVKIAAARAGGPPSLPEGALDQASGPATAFRRRRGDDDLSATRFTGSATRGLAAR